MRYFLHLQHINFYQPRNFDYRKILKYRFLLAGRLVYYLPMHRFAMCLKERIVELKNTLP